MRNAGGIKINNLYVQYEEYRGGFYDKYKEFA